MTILSILETFTPASAAQWLASFLANGATVGLPVTSWQTGGVARTIIAITSALQAAEDALVSTAAQGGFLDFAATGTVSYTGPNGQTIVVPVTPDPSIPAQFPNPGIAPPPGWLDFLADSTYNCQRILAAPASGAQLFANTSGSSSSSYAIGQYHVANPASGRTYSNTSPLTIAASTVIGGSVSGATNANPIVITTASAHGLSTGAQVYITGVVGNTAANGFFSIIVTSSTQFSLNGSNGSGAYSSGGTVYSVQQAPFAADIIGKASSTLANTITQPVTSLLGVFTTNSQSYIGTDVEGNVALAARCRLKLQALSPNGPKGAYAFFALSAFQLLANQVVSGNLVADAMTAAITQVTITLNTTNGVVTTLIGNSGAPGSGLAVVAGVASLPVTNATNATPIVVTVPSTAGLVSQMVVSITGVQGNTAANGLFNISTITGTTFVLNGSAGNGAYTSGGVIEAGDLGLVDSIIQANVVPNAVTAQTISALQLSVVVAATVYVPAAQASTIVGIIQTALANYQVTVPIGGFATGVPTPNSLPFNEVLGVIENSAPYVRAATLTLNSATVDVAVPSGFVVVFLPSGGNWNTAINVQTF